MPEMKAWYNDATTNFQVNREDRTVKDKEEASSRPSKPTARDIYENAHLRAQAQLEQIGELLFDLPAPDGETEIHFGHVGDLGEVNRRLFDVIMFLRSCG